MRGETMAIPVMIFNYLNSDASVDVTMENIGEFEFADYSNDLEAPIGTVENSHQSFLYTWRVTIGFVSQDWSSIEGKRSTSPLVLGNRWHF